jgi:hypothetical protein
MARCPVSFLDSAKAELAAEVEAESLYEAVALAVADFREDPLLKDWPGTITDSPSPFGNMPCASRAR